MKTQKWILVAEDDPAIAELTCLALAPHELKCELLVVPDGQAALDCVRHRGEFETHAEANPVFVLLDLKMPKVDGLEVLRQIKSDARLKSIPVIMFSSSHEPADIDRSYQLGANAFVVKPVEHQQFHETLNCVGRFWTSINEPAQEPPPAAVSPPPDPSHHEEFQLHLEAHA
jgi:CheY-like chemotaxis protein